MKPRKFIAAITILNTLTLCVSAYSAAAPKQRTPARGGQAATHMSSKGEDNTNAQWSADPERGWVRAEERHETNQTRQSTKDKKNRSKQNNERKSQHK
jgi:hypothetical protein